MTSAVYAQQDSILFRPEVERVFVEGMRLFEAGKFDSAASAFVQCIRDYPQSHRATGAYVMAGKAFHRAGNYREAVRLLKNLIDLYPQSSYLDDAHYTLGLSYYRMLRYEDAALEFLTARQQTSDALLKRRAESLLDDVVKDHLSIGQLQLLLAEATIDEMRALLAVRLAEKVFRAGDPKGAQQILQPITSLPPAVQYVDAAIALADSIEKGGVVKLGIVLPLMLKSFQPGARDLGTDMMDAMKLAADEHNQSGIPKIMLDFRDSERDPALAAKHVTELCTDDKVVAIIGPIFSNEALAAAGIANARGVPIVTPTATANGIADIGPFVFQANPDYEVRGRAMARFAQEVLQAKRLAVVAPIDAVGKLMAEAFMEQAKEDSLEVVDVQWYQSGATDLRQQLMNLRRRALESVEETIIDFSVRVKYQDVVKMVKLGVPQKRLDSLMEVGGKIPVEQLLGQNGARVADSLEIPTVRLPVKYDSLLIPVQNIDAIFLPIAAATEIGILPSQLQFFNFQAQMLGTGDWENLEELELNRQYTSGVIFSVDTYIDQQDPAYRLFEAKYQRAFNRKPTRNSLYAYDAMKLLVSVLEKGASTRQHIAALLPTVRKLPGLHSKISISERRVNSFLFILQYRNRAIQRIGEIDLTDIRKTDEHGGANEGERKQ
ncbi:MAG TPA: ABC transporter substrate-binding protein [Bacteroidota bacterium]|nr:ABC transporter substrate-binding protein [Bacteroidota bacterium]